HARAADDDRGPAIDVAVPYSTRPVIAGVIIRDQLPANRILQFFQVSIPECVLCTLCRRRKRFHVGLSVPIFCPVETYYRRMFLSKGLPAISVPWRSNSSSPGLSRRTLTDMQSATICRLFNEEDGNMRIVLALVTSLILIAVAVAPLPSLGRVAAQARQAPAGTSHTGKAFRFNKVKEGIYHAIGTGSLAGAPRGTPAGPRQPRAIPEKRSASTR